MGKGKGKGRGGDSGCGVREGGRESKAVMVMR